MSINQFIMVVLAEKVSALLTEEALMPRAECGSREKFDAALSQVPDVPTEPHDPL